MFGTALRLKVNKDEVFLQFLTMNIYTFYPNELEQFENSHLFDGLF